MHFLGRAAPLCDLALREDRLVSKRKMAETVDQGWAYLVLAAG